MIGKYIGDTGHFDGCTYGVEYWLEEHSKTQYQVTKNDLGGKSLLLKEKFELTEPLLQIAERVVREEGEK